MIFGSNLMIQSQSPRWCYSTQNYIEYENNCYHSIDDDEKTISDWFYLPYCSECKEYNELTNNICSQHLSHRISVTCNYCQNNFKRFNTREVRCSACCWSIKRNLKKTLEEIKKLANVNKIKGITKEYIMDELVRKVDNRNLLYDKEAYNQIG